jgi:hypothetical protein
MTRNVTLHLDVFGQRSLHRLLERRSVSTSSAALRTAAVYYLADRDSGRQAWRAPRFRSGPRPSPGLRVAFDDETWFALEEEAERQGVAPEELAVHALHYFVAELESGRLVEKIDEGLDDAD